MYSVIHYTLSQWQGILAIILIILGILVFIHGIQCSANTTFGSNRDHRHTYQAGGIILFLAGVIALIVTLVLSQESITPNQYHDLTHKVKQAPKTIKPQLNAYLKGHSKLTRMDYHNFISFYSELKDRLNRQQMTQS